MPSAVAKQAAWYEIGVFPGGCPSTALLAGGLPSDGASGRLAFAAGAATPPALGSLARQSYGIAATARAADCSVIATGCAALDVTGGGTLPVALTAVPGTAKGACEAGGVCEDARCLAGGDAAATLLGAGCSLELVGAGPLGDALAPDSTLLSAPAIAATPSGFLLAYREFDSSAGTARLTTISVDANAGAAAPVQTLLPGSCSGSPQTDATGLVFSGGAGTIAVSRPACPGGGDGGATAGGVDLLAIDGAGTITGSAFSGQSGLDISLAQAHALASTPAGTLLAYTNESTAASFAATVNGVGLAASPPPIAFAGLSGLPTTAAAMVVGTTYGTAFVALGTGTDDGGATSGVTASVTTTAADGGVAADAGGDGGSISARASSFAAEWASAGGVGSRVLVASNGASSTQSIQWTAFDIGASAPAATGSFAPKSQGGVSFVDVALEQDHAFFAAEVDQDISLFAFNKASTSPVFLREVAFSSQPTIPIGALRDGLVAVAASESRVAVVWLTGKTIGSSDQVGGYALFACAP